jgi:hypothetical protein
LAIYSAARILVSRKAESAALYETSVHDRAILKNSVAARTPP